MLVKSSEFGTTEPNSLGNSSEFGKPNRTTTSKEVTSSVCRVRVREGA